MKFTESHKRQSGVCISVRVRQSNEKKMEAFSFK